MINTDKGPSELKGESAPPQPTSESSVQSPRQHPGRHRRAVHSGMTPRPTEHGLAAARKRASGKGQGHGHHQQQHHRGQRPAARRSGAEVEGQGSRHNVGTSYENSRQRTRHAESCDGRGRNDNEESLDQACSRGSSAWSNSSPLSSSSSSIVSPRGPSLHRSTSSPETNPSSSVSSSSSSPRDPVTLSATLSTSTSSSSSSSPLPSSTSSSSMTFSTVSTLSSSCTTTTTTTTTIMSSVSISSAKCVPPASSSLSSSSSSSTTTKSTTTKTMNTQSASMSSQHRIRKNSENLDSEHDTETRLQADRQHSLDSSTLSDEVFTPRLLEHSVSEKLRQASAVCQFEQDFIVEDNTTSTEIAMTDDYSSSHPFTIQQEEDKAFTRSCKTNKSTNNSFDDNNFDTNIVCKVNDNDNIHITGKEHTVKDTRQSPRSISQSSKSHDYDQNINHSSTTQIGVNIDSHVTENPDQFHVSETEPPVLAKSAWFNDNHNHNHQNPQQELQQPSTTMGKNNSESDSSQASNQNQNSNNKPELRGKHCTNIERRAVLTAAFVHKPSNANIGSNSMSGNSLEYSLNQHQQQKRTHPLVKSKSSWRIHAARARESVANLISLVKFKDKDGSSADAVAGNITHNNNNNNTRVSFSLPRNKSSPCLTETLTNSPCDAESVPDPDEYRYSSSVDVLCVDSVVENETNNSIDRGISKDENKMNDGVNIMNSNFKTNDIPVTMNSNVQFQKSCELMSDQVQDNLKYVRKAVEDALAGYNSDSMKVDDDSDGMEVDATDKDDGVSSHARNVLENGVEIDAVYRGGAGTEESETNEMFVHSVDSFGDNAYQIVTDNNNHINAVDGSKCLAASDSLHTDDERDEKGDDLMNCDESLDDSSRKGRCVETGISSSCNDGLQTNAVNVINSGEVYDSCVSTESTDCVLIHDRIDNEMCDQRVQLLHTRPDLEIDDDKSITPSSYQHTTREVCYSSDENDVGKSQSHVNESGDNSPCKELDWDDDVTEEEDESSSVLRHSSPSLLKTLNAARQCLNGKRLESPNGQGLITDNVITQEQSEPGSKDDTNVCQSSDNSTDVVCEKLENNYFGEGGDTLRTLYLDESNKAFGDIKPSSQVNIECQGDSIVEMSEIGKDSQCIVEQNIEYGDGVDDLDSIIGPGNVIGDCGESSSDSDEPASLAVDYNRKKTELEPNGRKVSSKRRGSTSSLPSTKSSKRNSKREKSKRVEHLLSNQLFKKHLSKHADVIERKVFGMHNRCLRKSISNFDLSSAQSACIGNIVQHLVQSDANDAEDESDENDDDDDNNATEIDSDNNNNDKGDNENESDNITDIELKDERLRERPRQKLLRTKSLYIGCHSRTSQKEMFYDKSKDNTKNKMEEVEKEQDSCEVVTNEQEILTDKQSVPATEVKDTSRNISKSPTDFGSSHPIRSKRIHIPSFSEYRLRRQHSANDDVHNDAHLNDIYVIDEADGESKQSGETVLRPSSPVNSESVDNTITEIRSEVIGDTNPEIKTESTNLCKEIKTIPKRKSANVFVHPAIVVTSEDYAGLEIKSRHENTRRSLKENPINNRVRSPIGRRRHVIGGENQREGKDVNEGEGDHQLEPSKATHDDSVKEEKSPEENSVKRKLKDVESSRTFVVENSEVEEIHETKQQPEGDVDNNSSMLVSLGFTFDPIETSSSSPRRCLDHRRLETSKSLDLIADQSPTTVHRLSASAHSSPASSRSPSPTPSTSSSKRLPSFFCSEQQKDVHTTDKKNNKSSFKSLPIEDHQNVYEKLVSQVIDTTIRSPRRKVPVDQNKSEHVNNVEGGAERSSHTNDTASSCVDHTRDREKASVNVLELTDVAAGIDDECTISDDVKLSSRLDEAVHHNDNALHRKSPETSASDSDNKTSVLRSISDVSTMVSDDKEKRRRERKERPYKSDPFVGPSKRPTSLLSPDCNTSIKDTLSPSTSCSFPSLEELAEHSDSNSMYEDDEEDSRKRLNRLSTASSASEDSGVVSPYGGGDRKSEPKCPHCLAYGSNNRTIPGLTSPSSTTSTSSSSSLLLLSPVAPTAPSDRPPEFEPVSAIPTSSMCSKCVMKIRERKETIQEIAETEKRYGRDLAILKDEFYRPIKGTSLLTLDQLDAIFLNLDDLISAHKKFMDKLTTALVEAVRQGDEGLKSVEVGGVFVDSSTMFLAFENYCIHQSGSSAMLEQMEKEKELLKLFLQVAQNENPKLRRMHLKSFLMSPVQRVMKYPLLLGRLYKTTPCYHGDKSNIRQAQEKIEDILDHINNITHSVSRPKSRNQGGGAVSYSLGDKIEVNRIALEVLGWPKKEVCDILTSKLWYGQMPDVTWASKRARNVKFSMVHAALLSYGKPREDNLKSSVKQVALVLVREKGGKYSLVKDPFLMDRCVVTVDSSYDHVFELHEQGKETYLFKADHSKQTKVWSKQLQDLSRKLGFWRRRRNGLPNILLKVS